MLPGRILDLNQWRIDCWLVILFLSVTMCGTSIDATFSTLTKVSYVCIYLIYSWINDSIIAFFIVLLFTGKVYQLYVVLVCISSGGDAREFMRCDRTSGVLFSLELLSYSVLSMGFFLYAAILPCAT